MCISQTVVDLFFNKKQDLAEGSARRERVAEFELSHNWKEWDPTSTQPTMYSYKDNVKSSSIY